MSKQVTAVLVVGLLGVEAVGDVDRHGLYWVPEHLHTEIPVSDAGYSRAIALDSGSSTATATTGTIGYLESLAVNNYYAPVPFRGGTPEPREPVHPAEGERAGHTLFTGITSGAISNVVSNTIANTVTTLSLKPPSDVRSGFDFDKPLPNIKLKVSAQVVPQRRRFSIPYARRNC